VTSQIPSSLARFGDEYEQAARRELPRRAPRRPLRLAAAGSTALAAVAAGVVLTISATTGASPAYALTQNADGSITISLDNLTTGISQLNARLQQMGIDYTVIPVTADCPTSTPVLSVGTGSLSEKITIGTKNTEPAGINGYLAAEQLPNGQIAIGIGGMKTPLPKCFGPGILITQPETSQGSARRGARSQVTTATTTASAPLPLPRALRRQLNASRREGMITSATTTQSLPSATSSK
jgi:hypothetical protein